MYGNKNWKGKYARKYRKGQPLRRDRMSNMGYTMAQMLGSVRREEYRVWKKPVYTNKGSLYFYIFRLVDPVYKKWPWDKRNTKFSWTLEVPGRSYSLLLSKEMFDNIVRLDKQDKFQGMSDYRILNKR